LDATRNLLDTERVGWMKPTTHLIHAARGGIVDEQALCDALDNDCLAGAALDVFESEPLAPDHRLRRTKNVVLTPHLGASTKEAKRGVSLDIAHQVGTCLSKGIALNGVNVPRIAPSETAILSPYLNLVHNLSSFISQVFAGKLTSLRLTLQGALAEPAQRPLTVAMQVGALRPRLEMPVTPVNVERLAKDANVQVHSEVSSMKRDFMNMVRVETVIDGERHSVSGTVLGHRHGRMVEFDQFLLDAIPEGPLLVTFHADVPGVLGLVGTILGEEHINISRMQLGNPPAGDGPALGIWNLEDPLTDNAMARIRKQDPIQRACLVH
ncbi:MAG: NAD(P)-dependent oxidoreductase, partial [Planctomycetota bacterium]